MDQGNNANMNEMHRNNTLEINPNHPVVIKLNALRKKDVKTASRLSKQFLDNVLIQSNIPYNLQESTARNLDIMNEFLGILTKGNTSPLLESESNTSSQWVLSELGLATLFWA